MNERNKFEHKGIPIEIRDNGEFMAKVGGKEVVAPSLPALKKKLDRIDPFKPFAAFTIDWEGEVKKCTVVGVERHRRYNQYQWRTDNGYRHTHVYVALKENLALAKKLADVKAAQKKAEKEFEAKATELKDQLKEAPMPGTITES
jgi:hypothetical protein